MAVPFDSALEERRCSVKERGIIFRDWEVRAILDGRKTMFRRAIQPQPSKEALGAEVALPGSDVWQFFNRPNRQGKHNGGILVSTVKCPFGTVGDRLWVKESLMVQPSKGCTFGEVMRGSKLSVQYKNYEYSHEYYGRWRSPATMPRWASRITLEIVNVRVERVQEITEQDAIAEGSQTPLDQLPKKLRSAVLTERCMFARIWNYIHGPDAWDRNDWVWAVTFKRLEGGAT